MKRRARWTFSLFCIALLHQFAAAQTAPESLVRRALSDELKRAVEVLGQKSDPPAYFINYQVTETTNVTIEGSRGALRNSTANKSRYLDIDVRVGDYVFDNTHQIRGQRGVAGAPNFTAPVSLPLDNDLDAMKSVIWLETDRRYKAAVERFIQVKANREVKVEEEDTSADLSRETAQTAALPLVHLDVKVAEWENKIKQYSALFKNHADILDGSAAFTASATNQYLVNSEGTSVQHGSVLLRVSFYARTKAEDGMELDRFESFDAHSFEALPDDRAVGEKIAKIVNDLKALRVAPVIEPYTGPAILSGRANGVFFHEIFGHRMEGQRQRGEGEGQTFTRQINKPVLPEFISVYDDPTTKRMAGIDLNGSYAYDDDGVPAQRVAVVENGILRNFLLSRSPVAGFEKSNGHGRKAPGYRSVGRQGNLIVQASNTVTDAKLREMLIEEAKKQDKPFGLLFDAISGGFTTTQRFSPQAFQVTPILVYRVYVDGRPDELVRGAELIGTPLTSFSKIIAASDTLEVFNGYCGAESGFIPVSAVAPSILTSQIEVQKKAKSSERLPILPPPAESRAF